MLAPLRHEQFGLLINCLITGFVCGLLLPWPTRFIRSEGFTAIARRAEIVIRTISSVSNPRAAASPGDKSATRPVEGLGPQSTGRASTARPFAGLSTRARARRRNSLGVSL